jgi:hypothetical protein
MSRSSRENLDVSELTEVQLIALEKKIQTEMFNRNSPNWDLTELTTQELQDLEKKVKEQKAKGTVIDFNHSKISVHNYSKVIDALKEKEKSLTIYPLPLSIRLGENHLEDSEVNIICQVILDSKILRENLVKLELNHNQLKNGSLNHLRKIVEACPSLKKLNAAINYINYEQFHKVFEGLSNELTEKVKYNV